MQLDPSFFQSFAKNNLFLYNMQTFCLFYFLNIFFLLELESDCLLKYNVGGVFSSQFILWAICVVFVWKLLNLLAGTILLGQLADRGVNGVMIFFADIVS